MRLCCPHRHHLTGPVRVPLRPSPNHLSVSGFAAQLFVSERRRPCGVQVLRFVSIIACRRPYSGSPIGACSHYFPIDNGLRPKRRGSACSRGMARFIPVHPTLPAMRVGGELSRSCSVHSDYYGLRIWSASLTGSHKWRSRTTVSNSGLPCRGKFRRDVTNATRPLPIQPNGILLNQTPFILEETNFKPRTRYQSPGGDERLSI